MRTRESLEAIRDITALRSVQVDVAAQALHQADTLWSGATRERDDACHERDTAVGNWLALLQSRFLDPAMAAISGQWLVEREAMLRSARLNETIAQRNRVAAESTLAERHAELDTSKQIGERVKRGISKRAEEMHARELADGFLRRRSR
jgi:hypothetical protein